MVETVTTYQVAPEARDHREALGRIVRAEWVRWASEQPDPKLSWLVGWDELDAGQREVDMRIGEAVQASALARERQRVAELRAALETILKAGNAAWNAPGKDGVRPTDPYIECVTDTAADALAADAPGQRGEGEQQ